MWHQWFASILTDYNCCFPLNNFSGIIEKLCYTKEGPDLATDLCFTMWVEATFNLILTISEFLSAMVYCRSRNVISMFKMILIWMNLEIHFFLSLQGIFCILHLVIFSFLSYSWVDLLLLFIEIGQACQLIWSVTFFT